MHYSTRHYIELHYLGMWCPDSTRTLVPKSASPFPMPLLSHEGYIYLTEAILSERCVKECAMHSTTHRTTLPEAHRSSTHDDLLANPPNHRPTYTRKGTRAYFSLVHAHRTRKEVVGEDEGAATRPNKNCTSRRCFTSSVRAIGSSFQLAITAPQSDLTGYGTATAQSCPTTTASRQYPRLSLLPSSPPHPYARSASCTTPRHLRLHHHTALRSPILIQLARPSCSATAFFHMPSPPHQ